MHDGVYTVSNSGVQGGMLGMYYPGYTLGGVYARYPPYTLGGVYAGYPPCTVLGMYTPVYHPVYTPPTHPGYASHHPARLPYRLRGTVPTGLPR